MQVDNSSLDVKEEDNISISSEVNSVTESVPIKVEGEYIFQGILKL